ncbi:MAG: hypothetical protein AAGI46_04675 [Planctomycetota bacterium]
MNSNALFEGLEGRKLLAADLSSFGMLRVAGDAGVENAITVTQVDSTITVDVNGTVDTFAVEDVRAIRIAGRELADTIDVDASVPVRVLGGPGNDTITSSGFVQGGFGNDTITGTEGRNILHGGPGDDVLVGLGGNDFLVAGFGDDQLDGGEGDDTLIGARGANTLVGGIGADRFFLNLGANTNDSSDFDADDGDVERPAWLLIRSLRR